MFIGEFLGDNKMAPSKIQNGGYFAHSKVLNAYNYCFSSIQLILQECLLDSFQRATKWDHKKIKMAEILRMRKF